MAESLVRRSLRIRARLCRRRLPLGSQPYIVREDLSFRFPRLSVCFFAFGEAYGKEAWLAGKVTTNRDEYCAGRDSRLVNSSRGELYWREAMEIIAVQSALAALEARRQ